MALYPISTVSHRCPWCDYRGTSSYLLRHHKQSRHRAEFEQERRERDKGKVTVIVARFLDRMCLALRASGLWLRYATLQNLIPSFPWIAPHALHPGAIQGKEGIKFCYLVTQVTVPVEVQQRAAEEAWRAYSEAAEGPAASIKSEQSWS